MRVWRAAKREVWSFLTSTCALAIWHSLAVLVRFSSVEDVDYPGAFKWLMRIYALVTFDLALLAAIRDRFHHADVCPIQGPRAFLENAGGSLTLKAAVERTAELMAFPDNQGRASLEVLRRLQHQLLLSLIHI